MLYLRRANICIYFVMIKKIKILLIDNNPNDIKIITREIINNFKNAKIVNVNNRNDFDKEIRSFQPHLVITELNLPEFDCLKR